jgi:hypothetical protein
MSLSVGVVLLVVLSTLPGYVHAAAGTTSDTVARGSFAALPPADKDVARALYKAQTGPEILTLDEIAELRRQGRGWEAVFKEMKARGAISAPSLNRVLRPAARQPVAIVIAEGTTLQRTERVLFEEGGVVGRRAPVHARFRAISVSAADYGRLLDDIQKLRDLPEGSRVLFEGSVDGRHFAVEVHRLSKLLDIRTVGLGFRSLGEAQRFAESFLPDTSSRLRVRGTIDGHRVEVRRVPFDTTRAPAAPRPSTGPGGTDSSVPLGPPAGTSNLSGGSVAPPIHPPTGASLSPSAKGLVIQLAPDPAGGVGIGGFSRNHWISSRQKMLSPFGGGLGPIGDNSLRLYDPVRDMWEYVWPSGHMNGGVQRRDNHGSFYVPALDEFWVWGGSYLETYPGLTGGKQPYRSGRFSFRTNKWVAVGHSDTDAFVGVVKGGPVEFSIDAATGWSAELDMGVVFGGYRVGNPTDLMYLVEPNPNGPERYRWTQYAGPRPPARSMVHNAMVAAGRDFYLFGGGTSARQEAKDFWKFDGVARTWTRLPDPPVTSGVPAVTYDSDRRLVVAWAGDRLLAYAIDSNRWLDVTPPGLPCVYNHMAVYASSARMHIYQGGNRCGDGLPALQVIGVRLGDTAAPEAPAMSPGRSSTARQSGSPAGSSSEPASRFSTTAAPQGATSQPSSTPLGTGGLSGQIMLPIKTWVKRPLPSPPDGPCTPPYGCKHVRPAFNLQNGRIYFFGGDYHHKNYPGTFSYSISEDRWQVEYPACGPPGDISPMFPDQTAWSYDSRRNLLYWTGGFHWDKPEAICVGGSARRGPALTFDPSLRRWSTSPFTAQPTGGSPSAQFAVYDPVTDSVIHLGLYRGDNSAIILRLATNTWEAVNLSFSENGRRLDHGNWTEDNQPAIDVKGRAVYLVDRGPNHAKPRLLRYSIDRRTVTNLGPTPQQTGLGIPLLAWDSVNNVLYWLTAREYQGSVVWAYHPDPTGGANGRWERLDMATPDGVTARGNLLVFDPLQNALLLMGGVNWNNEPDPSFLKYLFLYRYGDGSR